MMARQNELCARRALSGEGGDKIVPAQMGVNYIDPVMVYYFGDGRDRLKIERISQRHLVPGSDQARKRRAERAFGPDGQIYRMASAGKLADETGHMYFSTSHFGCRAYLENLHGVSPDIT
jgi:hypothetical protein